MKEYVKTTAKAIGQLECNFCGFNINYCANCKLPFEDDGIIYCIEERHLCEDCNKERLK